MKRVVISSLIVLFFLIVFATGFFYFQRYSGIIGGKPVNAIPTDAVVFVETDLSSGLSKQFLEAPYWKDLQQNKFFDRVNKNLLFFDSIVRTEDLEKLFSKEPLLISVHVTKANEFDLLFLSSIPVSNQENFVDETISKLILTNEKIQTRMYENTVIKELRLKDKKIFTYAISKNVFLGSFTAFLVENGIRQQKVAGKPLGNDKAFNELYIKAVQEKSTKIFINYRNLPDWLSIFKDSNKSGIFRELGHFASWSVFTPETDKQSVFLKGNTIVQDSTDFLFLLASQQPVELSIINILPRKTAVAAIAGYSNRELFLKSFEKYLGSSEKAAVNTIFLKNIKSEYNFSAAEKFYSITGNEFALLITEPASSNYENTAYFILKTKDVLIAKKNLQSICIQVDKIRNEPTMQEKYNNYSIGLIRLQGLIPALYGESFRIVNKMYYTFIGNYSVFANQASSLRTLIDDYRSGNLLIKESMYRSASVKLPWKTNYLIYSDIPASRYLIKSVLSPAWNQSLDSAVTYLNKWGAFSYSISGGNKSLSSSILLKYNISANSIDEATLVWSTKLDSSISMKPQVVSDATLNARCIMIQDDANTLYLIDNSGNILWKKQLSEKIKGDIHAIDLYKNNSSQYLFNTSDRLYLMDINGNNISNYPIRLPAASTNALSVFDFEGTRDYRIFVACDNRKVYGYEGRGKPLAGWNFDSESEIITQPIQFFTLNEKKCLVFSDNSGNVFILDRFGTPLITTSDKVLRKLNCNFYFEEDTDSTGNLVTLDSSGNIIKILMNGEVETNSIESVSSSEYFLLNDVNGDNISDYVFLEPSRISAYNNKMNLLFTYSFDNNVASGMNSFHLSHNKCFIGVHSIFLNKLFLLTNEGMLFKGFPVKGSTPFIINQLNNDEKFYLIAGSEDGNIYVYSLD